MSDSVQPDGQQPTRLLCPQDSLDKKTGVGCHFLLHQARILEWIAMPSFGDLPDPGIEPVSLMHPESLGPFERAISGTRVFNSVVWEKLRKLYVYVK